MDAQIKYLFYRNHNEPAMRWNYRKKGVETVLDNTMLCSKFMIILNNWLKLFLEKIKQTLIIWLTLAVIPQKLQKLSEAKFRSSKMQNVSFTLHNSSELADG